MKSNPTSYIIALAILVLGIIGSYLLLSKETIGEASFVTLIFLSVFTALIVGYSKQISYMKFPQFEIKLREMKETEESIKEMASALLEYIEASTESMVTHGFDKDKYESARNKVKTLIR